MLEVVAARLAELVGYESPSHDVEALAALRDDLASRWRDLGLDVETRPGELGDHLVATWRSAKDGAGARPALLVLAHYDTVWPRGEIRRQPFRVDGDRAYGPGTFDMKGGIVALESAIARVVAAGAAPAQDVRVVCVADEEMSSVDGRRVVEEAMAGVGAALGLEPCHPDGAFKLGRRGLIRVRLSVEGRSAHAGLDAAKGVSAIDELVDQLRSLRDELPDALDLGVNVGVIEGGTRANVVAESAHADIAFRFASASTEAAVIERLAGLAGIRDGARVDVEVVAHRPAWEPGDQRLARHVETVSDSPGHVAASRYANGAGDTNFTGAAGIPTLDGLGPRGDGAHAVGEYVELSSIDERADLLADLFVRPLPAELVTSLAVAGLERATSPTARGDVPPAPARSWEGG